MSLKTMYDFNGGIGKLVRFVNTVGKNVREMISIILGNGIDHFQKTIAGEPQTPLLNDFQR